MADYRLYWFNDNGHIGLGDWINAETDELAIAEALKLRPEAHKCEIWLETRLVAKLDAQGAFETA
jgi:hypothetical protein